MTFSQLRYQVDSLCRKYAAELEIHRMRPLALDFCDEMADAVTGEKRGPAMPVSDWALLFMRRMSDSGFRPGNLVGLLRYLERCLELRFLPQLNDLLRAVLPGAAQRGLIPRSQQNVPF